MNAEPRRMVKRQMRMAVAALLGVLPAGSVRARQAPSPGGANDLPPAAQTLKISVEVVNVYAVVWDHKRLVPNLRKEDFELTEDNVPQSIKYFSRQTDTPLTLVIGVDTSPSQQRVLPIEQEAAKNFIRQVIRPKDLASVLHFDLQVELLQDFTSDPNRLSRAVDEMVINGGGQGPLPGTFPTSGRACCTQLYDAVYLASTDLLKQEVGRKVLILLTDGVDAGSKETLNAALEAAQRNNVIIYSIDIADRAFYGVLGMAENGDSVLGKLSNETGGRVIRVSRASQTAAAFDEIANELRTQYLLGYTPTNSRHDGTYRRIRVRTVNGNYKVQARRGYYAPLD